ncbi:MAG: hypothetical protein LBV34_11435, partial [Nocardiopsaceae bacterium]|nr:hypothetical protein [Nocardiopsaceae bacterium]
MVGAGLWLGLWVGSAEQTQMVAAIYEVARAGLNQLAGEEREDTYVVSFFVYDEDDDPRSPTLTVGSNTLSRVEFTINQPADFVKPHAWWTPTDEEEARWNYAFWLQNQLGKFPHDQDQLELLDRWLQGSGLWFEEPEDSDDWASLGPPITARFVQICVEVAQLLHRS